MTNRAHRLLNRREIGIAFATLFIAISMFFASAVDVRAMLTPEAAALRGVARHEPVVMPEEWVWRGRPPINVEYMYGNREKPQPDYIVMHRAQ
jgi:hypothetical protein